MAYHTRAPCSGGITELDARRAQFVEQITAFVSERKLDEALTRQQLGGLEGIDRLAAQRQSLLDNTAAYYAGHPGADVAPGLLMLITFYSDNDDGACTLAVERAARFLSRSPRSILDALQRLELDRLILVERRPGRTSLTTPWVHNVFGSIRDPLTWIMDARAPAQQNGKPGRRVAIRSTMTDQEIPLTSASPQFTNTPEDAFTPVGNTPEAGQQIPLKPTSPNTTRNTAKEKKEDDPFAELKPLIDEAQLEEFNRLFSTWGTSRASASPQAHRSVTDRFLYRELAAHSGEAPETLRAGCLAALNTLLAAAHDKASGTSSHGRAGGQAMLAYFRKVLRTEIGNLKLANASLQARARTEQLIAEKRLVQGSFAVGAPARAHRRMSLDDIAAQAFPQEEIEP